MAEEMIEFRCSECRASFCVSADKAGTWHYCSTCRVNVPVPHSSEDPQSVEAFDVLKDLGTQFARTAPVSREAKSLPPPRAPEPMRITSSELSEPDIDLFPALETKSKSTPLARNADRPAKSKSADQGLDDLEVVSPESEDAAEDLFGDRPTRPRDSQRSKARSQKSQSRRLVEPDSASANSDPPASVMSGWKWFGWIVAGEVGALLLGFILLFVNPSLVLWLIGGYVLTGLVLFVAAWFLGFAHALKNENYLSAVLFFLPLYFVRYGVREWPATRPSIAALAMGFIWIVGPFIVGMPVSMVASFFGLTEQAVAEDLKAAPPETPEPAAQAAAGQPVADGNEPPENPNLQAGLNADPQQPAANPNPPSDPLTNDSPQLAVPSGPPQHPVLGRNNQFSTSYSVRTEPDGTTVTTIVENRRSTVNNSRLNPREVYEDSMRSMQLRRKLREFKNKVGESFVAEVKGSTRGFCWGGKDGVYTVDSMPDVAAVHAGLVKAGQTAKIKFTIQSPADDYPAIEQNGIRSMRWPGSRFYNSVKIELAKDEPQQPKHLRE